MDAGTYYFSTQAMRRQRARRRHAPDALAPQTQPRLAAQNSHPQETAEPDFARTAGLSSTTQRVNGQQRQWLPFGRLPGYAGEEATLNRHEANSLAMRHARKQGIIATRRRRVQQQLEDQRAQIQSRRTTQR